VVLPNLSPRSAKTALTIAGDVTEPNLPMKISVRINRKYEHLIRVTKRGAFEERILLPERICREDSYHVELVSNKNYVPARFGATKDNRRLAFVLRRLEIH
jgi:hypothetical protein